MNRGSAGSLTNRRAGDTRFNEAPIHESGKYPSDLPRCGRDRRFNEAPIHESGKCLDSAAAVYSGNELQ